MKPTFLSLTRIVIANKFILQNLGFAFRSMQNSFSFFFQLIVFNIITF